MRNHLKRNGYIYIEKNIRPAYVKVGNPDNGSIRRSKVEKGNTPEHIRKVYNDIFHDIKYSLDILDNADIDTLPFHITVESKHYKFRKGLQRVMILKFPRKTKMYSRKTKKKILILIKKHFTRKTKKKILILIKKHFTLSNLFYYEKATQ